MRKGIFWILTLLLLSITVATAKPTGRIPDSGQTISYTDTFGEDSDYLINPPSYTKLDASGNDLSDDATSWTTVRDNVTGLIWEVKTDDGSVHNKDNCYTWYDSNPATNGGNAGTPGTGTDTEDFINELNNSNYGGSSDWRMPTIEELRSIVDYGRFNPAINASYFPNTMSRYLSWSSSTLSHNSLYAWSLGFHDGWVSPNRGKNQSIYVRAVRAGQSVIGSLDHWIIWFLTMMIPSQIPIPA